MYLIPDYFVTCFGQIQSLIFKDGQITTEESVSFSDKMLSGNLIENISLA